MTRRRTAGLLLAVTIPTGILWRMAPWPYLLWKYGGSILWTVALYLALILLFPRMRPAAAALTGAVIALAVELSRLLHTPAYDAFKASLSGRLLIGRFFSIYDIAAYWVALLALFCIDTTVQQRRTRLAHNPSGR